MPCRQSLQNCNHSVAFFGDVFSFGSLHCWLQAYVHHCNWGYSANTEEFVQLLFAEAHNIMSLCICSKTLSFFKGMTSGGTSVNLRRKWDLWIEVINHIDLGTAHFIGFYLHVCVCLKLKVTPCWSISSSLSIPWILALKPNLICNYFCSEDHHNKDIKQRGSFYLHVLFTMICQVPQRYHCSCRHRTYCYR